MPKVAEIKALLEAGGKYTILSEFTEGVNGYAFRGFHKHLECEVFLKVIDADPETEKTFAEPKAIMDALSHESCANLVRLHDAEHLNSDYIVMSTEFIEGGSLNSYITNRVFGQMEAVKITLGVLSGLAHLHKERFLHRDVKPGNLLLKSAASGLVPKVGDFGSVRRLEAQETQVPASRHSALYRPPEAWGDSGWFTFSSDLYQAAVCLYEMVNGPLPYDFEAYLDAQAKKQMKEMGVTSLKALDACDRSLMADGCLERRIQTNKLLEMAAPQLYLSRRLAAVIRRATAVNPADRYQDAFSFHNALQGLSLPNWKEDGAVFTAVSWFGWDWKIAPSPPDGWTISRARQSTGNYRRYGAVHLTSQAAFRTVEDFS